MDVISLFDPWNDPLCSCPVKYSLNPYTGCSHGCIYCYISSYIPRAFESRVKKDILIRVERDMRKLDRLPISMSNSSDPYPPLEAKNKLTRGVLEIIKRYRHPLLIVTKSDLVTRDIDLLREMDAVVMITITTLDPVHKKTEPGAPSPKRRLKAMAELSEAEIPVGLRLDPIIPGISNDYRELIESTYCAGASHVVASTFKPRPDGWNRFKKTFPKLSSDLRPLYFEEGEVHQSSRYLPKELRRKILSELKYEVEDREMTFSTCREGMFKNEKACCDGSFMLKEPRPTQG
ncbi:MAG: radical SAM protein [Halobacteriota archaeon]|nr:radical SAM protein [Halobacteriota archaeon]